MTKYIETMAHLRSVTRALSSARTAACLGSTVNPSRISCIRSPKLDAKDDLCAHFRHLVISPDEASLSATFMMSISLPVEYRLPSVVKPVNITFPSLHSGVLLEKDLPPIPNITEKIDPIAKRQIKEAPPNQVTEKQAARLIVIRRQKMKKHKLRKLRKKMKFVYLKARQKREYKKEKLFQATQMSLVREFEAFDAANFVADILQKTKQNPSPKL